MNTIQSTSPRHFTRTRLAGSLVAALLLLMGTPNLALAIDCSTWTSAQSEGRDLAFEAAIDDLLNSPKADQWTTLNKPVIKHCLLAIRGRIQAEFDGLCAKGMQTGMDALDNKLYDYALGCVRA